MNSPIASLLLRSSPSLVVRAFRKGRNNSHLCCLQLAAAASTINKNIGACCNSNINSNINSSGRQQFFSTSSRGDEGSALKDIYGTGASKSSYLDFDRSDEQLLKDLKSGQLSHEKLEALVKDPVRAIKLRKKYIHSLKVRGQQRGGDDDASLPVEFKDGDCDSYYSQVNGSNCESVIGFVPVPVGVVGPLVLDGVSHFVPLATTEGSLISSTNRGARAISLSGGADTVIYQDGMTRAPALQCRNLAEAADVKEWIDTPAAFKYLQSAFASTTKHGKLDQISVKLAGRILYVKLRCTTGDAMGMSIIGKGANEVTSAITKKFPAVTLLTLSGNLCTDKKPAAVNWIEGRGKSVASEAVIPQSIVRDVLKTSVKSIVEVNTAKNLVGSALAGTMGGSNAHASNVVTSIFIATGQDPAQNIESSNCLTFMEETPQGDLRISVTMPCVEVGTVGGGTSLPAQKWTLQLLGVAGAHPEHPGANAKQLARIIAGTVLAGELSLMAALSSNYAGSKSMQAVESIRKAKSKIKTDNIYKQPASSSSNSPNNKIYNDLNKFLHVDVMSEDVRYEGNGTESEELLLDQGDNATFEENEEGHDDEFDKYSRMF